MKNKKDLLYNLVSIINKAGVIGEQDSILALLNKVNLRLVKNADPISSNVIVSDVSGIGKDFLVKTLCNSIIPETYYIHRTYLTSKVFVYWIVNWNKKVLHIEDPEPDLLNTCIFKTMASGSSKATVVNGQEAIEIEIIGKPTIIVTSAKSSIDDEGIRRWDTISLDGSKDLTKAILKSISSKSSIINFTENEKKITKYIKELKPLSVSIPFTNKLVDIISNDLLSRTLFKKLLDYIKSSAVIHNRSIATWYDYEYARLCFWKMNSFGNIPLNSIERELIRILKNASYPLSIREISSIFKHGIKWIYRNKDRLKELGLIEEHYEFNDNANKEILKLSSTSNVNEVLPNSVKLSENKVTDFEAFDKLLAKLDNNREKLGLKPIFNDFRK